MALRAEVPEQVAEEVFAIPPVTPMPPKTSVVLAPDRVPDEVRVAVQAKAVAGVQDRVPAEATDKAAAVEPDKARAEVPDGVPAKVAAKVAAKVVAKVAAKVAAGARVVAVDVDKIGNLLY